MLVDTPKRRPVASCETCWKPESLCLCHNLSVFPNRIKILILQHPAEVRSPLGTARLTSLSLQNSVHRIGLSWRSLSKAVGEPVDPQKWAVLYLGGRKSGEEIAIERGLISLDKNGKPVPLRKDRIEGIVVLDGNWKQAKALWWRNPWLSKLPRLFLSVETPSQYGKIRREPRKTCLSTLEAAAAGFSELGDRKTGLALKERMGEFVRLIHAWAPPQSPPAPTDKESELPPEAVEQV
jgi:DTW domain-containing protein